MKICKDCEEFLDLGQILARMPSHPKDAVVGGLYPPHAVPNERLHDLLDREIEEEATKGNASRSKRKGRRKG